jgi:ABC-type multidrug transport system permease subunit
MKAALTIGHNDVRLFLREKTIFIWLLVVPLVFTYFLGYSFRGPGDPSAPQPAVRMENQDTGFLGQMFLEELGTQGLRLVDATNRDEAKRGLRIPPDFTTNILNRQPVKLAFFTVEGSGEEAAALVELRLWRALIAFHAHLVEQATITGGAAPTEEALRAVLRRENPVALKSTYAGRKPIPVGFSFSLPGNLVSYLLMNLMIFGGATVTWERRAGVLRRLTIHPIRQADIILGKLYGLMLLGLVQITFFLLLGQFLFRVNIGEHFGSILSTLLVLAWVAASLGILVGSLVTAEEKVIGLCVLASLGMAAVGGCWWPLEIAPDSFKTVAHLIPTGWAMDALHQLITFGGGFAEAWQEIGVLCLFGAGATLAAVKCFRV